MRNIVAPTALAVTLTVIGCAAPNVQEPDEVIREANAPLVCTTVQECSDYWRRAQVWIVENSRWKLQTVSDAVLVTYTPTGASVDRGYRVTRVPLGQGREQIKIASGCDNMIRCHRGEHEVAAAFKRYVRGQ